jgi:hypothetical protein
MDNTAKDTTYTAKHPFLNLKLEIEMFKILKPLAG